MAYIIATPQPDHFESSQRHQQYGFGYFNAKRDRSHMEDSLAWHTLDDSELSPEEIGYRLWTTYQLLDQQVLAEGIESGTTASTTVYDGRGNLITATLADASTFAVIYDQQGDPLGVIRLNSIVHKATVLTEQVRIQQAGGFIAGMRVNGSLAVSRAIGDWSFNKEHMLVPADAKIDILNIRDWAAQRGIRIEDIGNIQIIAVSDGYTDGAGSLQSKLGHERYLHKTLKKFSHPGKKPEDQLAKELADKARQDGSDDNITIGVQTIYPHTGAFLLGAYDGHMDAQASIYVAEHIGPIFKSQCNLSPKDYAAQEWSVHAHMKRFTRDNKYLDEQYTAVVYQLRNLVHNYQATLKRNIPEHRLIRPILERLDEILKDKRSLPDDKILQFYNFLAAPGLKRERYNEDTFAIKNMDLIKRDPNYKTINFLKGIALLAATVLTGILPGLLIMGIVWGATARHPGDLLMAEGDRFEKEVSLLKARHSSFFKPVPDNGTHKTDSRLDTDLQGVILQI